MDKTNKILEFGIKRENEERRDGGSAFVFDPETQMYAVGEVPGRKVWWIFSGGVDASEDLEQGVLREVTEESGLYDFLSVEKLGDAFVHYRNPLKNVNRSGSHGSFLVILKSRHLVETKLEEHEKFILRWVSGNELLKNWEENENRDSREHWIYFWHQAIRRAKELGYDTTSSVE